MSVAASRAIKSSCSNFSTPSLLTELTPGGGLPARAVRLNDAKQRLVEQVFTLWDGSIQEACRFSSVPAEFLGALTANESGGDGAAVRFEPAVYSHLKAVALGEAARWGSITARTLAPEVAQELAQAAVEVNADSLRALLLGGQGSETQGRAEQVLRDLATSWGLTQIMGFHLIGRRGAVQDLLDAHFHYHLANQLLAEFADRYQVDLATEFEEMFRCWNTGSPDGRTADPAYVSAGLERMEIYRSLIGAQEAQKKN